MDGQTNDLLLKAGTEAVLIIENKKIIAFNYIALSMFEYDKEEFTGMLIEVLFSSPMSKPVESLCRIGESINTEAKVITAKGQSFFAQIKSKIIIHKNRNFTSVTIRDISDFMRSERESPYKDVLLESLGFAAAHFLESRNWQNNINGVLQHIGISVGMSRIYIFQNITDDDGVLYMSQKHEWVADGIEPQINNPVLQKLAYKEAGFQRLSNHLSVGKVIHGLVKDFPDVERVFLESQDIKSIFITPIFQHKHWWGFIGYDECYIERVWTQNEKQLLKTVADIFTAALEREIVEEKLLKTNENFRSLFNNSPDGIFVYDYDGYVLDVNEAGCLLNKIPKNKIVNTHVSKLVPDEESEKISDEFKKWITGEYKIIESVSKSDDGKIIPVEIRGKKIDYFDRPAILLLVRDISKRRESEQLLRKGVELIRFISRISSEFIKMDIDNIEQALNNALEFVCIYTGNERGYVFQPNSTESVMFLTNEYCHPDYKSYKSIVATYHVDEFYDFIQKMKTGKNMIFHFDEIVRTEKNANVLQILETLQSQTIINIPLKVGEHFLGYIGIDSTTQKKDWDNETLNAFILTAQIFANTIIRKKSEEKLIEAKNKAEQSDHLKTVFLSQMSHELRTPLNSIIGFAEILEREIPNVEQQSMTKFILTGGERLLNTLNLIIDLSEIESNIMQAHIEETNLNKFVKKLIPILSLRANEKNLVLRYIETEKEIRIKTDRSLLDKIIFNLVDNAIKYTKTGNINITVTVDEMPKNDYAVLIVKDTGIGISKEKIKYIFSKFRQASEGYNREFEGAGLGLSVTKGLVELLDGEISVTSEIDKGSEFIIRFPLLKSGNNSENPPTLFFDSLEKPREKAKILVIEDEIAHQRYLHYILEQDYELIFANTGLEALKIVNNILFGLIIIDINLGKSMNGLEVMLEIRKIEGYKEAPIIAATANAMKGQKERYLENGFSHYLSKPYKAIEMKSLVDSILIENITKVEN